MIPTLVPGSPGPDSGPDSDPDSDPGSPGPDSGPSSMKASRGEAQKRCSEVGKDLLSALEERNF